MLTQLQHRILMALAANRSETSYVAGGAVLNKDWPRRSDDIDIFHDTDEEIAAAAYRDIDTLRMSGFRVRVDIDVYGIVEAVVEQQGEETQIQWMSETRRRFLPLIRDEIWGARLAPADLAVNKVLAASTRRKARDIVDIETIGDRLCPLGPLVMAAAGKPPHFSPQRTLDEIRRTCLSIWEDDYLAVKGTPEGWTPAILRERVLSLISKAETYIAKAPLGVVGRLAIDARGVPIELTDPTADGIELRAATEEPEVIPQLRDVSPFRPS